MNQRPSTKAGRALIEWARNAAPDQLAIWTDRALLIEEQARASAVLHAHRVGHRGTTTCPQDWGEDCWIMQDALALVRDHLATQDDAA